MVESTVSLEFCAVAFSAALAALICWNVVSRIFKALGPEVQSLILVLQLPISMLLISTFKSGMLQEPGWMAGIPVFGWFAHYLVSSALFFWGLSFEKMPSKALFAKLAYPLGIAMIILEIVLAILGACGLIPQMKMVPRWWDLEMMSVLVLLTFWAWARLDFADGEALSWDITHGVYSKAARITVGASIWCLGWIVPAFYVVGTSDLPGLWAGKLYTGFLALGFLSVILILHITTHLVPGSWAWIEYLRVELRAQKATA